MSKKIIVIGGGIAGLSAGIYGRLNGFDTHIIEMHSVTGGQCTAWDRKGFRFDYCLHWLVGTRKGPFNKIWIETNVLNEDVKVIDHEIHTKVHSSDGREFIIYTSLDKWESYLCQMAPEDTISIKKMCRHMRRSTLLEPYTDPPELRKFWQTITSAFRMIPIMILFMKYGKMSCKDYFKKLNFKNRDLVFFLDNLYGSFDFSALAFIMMLAWFNQKNAGYLVGGSLPMAQRMSSRFLELGGIITTNEKVSKIIVENDVTQGVVLSDGSEIHSDYVISACDGHSTIFDMLDSRYTSKKIMHAYENWELFTPIVQVSFGINREIKSDSQVESFIDNDISIGRTILKRGYSIMNYYFDPTMAPKGKTVLVMRFESPWDIWKDLDGKNYKSEKKTIASDCTAILEKRHPGIAKDIEVIDVATPKTDVKYTGVWKGSYEGFMPSSKNLMDNLKMRLPGLKKFYMAGQWLTPGGGLPPAGQTGKWAIQYICKEEKVNFKNS